MDDTGVHRRCRCMRRAEGKQVATWRNTPKSLFRSVVVALPAVRTSFTLTIAVSILSAGIETVPSAVFHRRPSASF